MGFFRKVQGFVKRISEKIIVCPFCGKEISELCSICPYCKKELKEK